MFTRHQRYLSIALMLLAGATSNPASAQTKTLTTPIDTAADITPRQQRVLQDLRALPTTKSLILVRVDTGLLRSGEPVFINVADKTLKLEADRAEVADDNVTWRGRLVDPATGRKSEGANPSATIFTAVGGDTEGAIVTTAGTYRLRPLGGGLHALIIVDTAKFPADHPRPGQPVNPLRDGGLRPSVVVALSRPVTADVAQVPGLIPAGAAALALDNTAKTTVRVLVAYTSNVAKRASVDPAAVTRNAIAMSNQSYENSGVAIKLEATASSPMSLTYKESGNYDTDIAALVGKGDGKMEEVHMIRAQERANLVILLVDNGSYCGQAAKIGATRETAFAMVYHDCAVENLSFAHEIGHLGGARHNWEFDPTPGYGHGYINLGRKQRTVMAYASSDCADCIRVPQWSRPPEWGTPDREHDARMLNENSKTMGGW